MKEGIIPLELDASAAFGAVEWPANAELGSETELGPNVVPPPEQLTKSTAITSGTAVRKNNMVSIIPLASVTPTAPASAGRTDRSPCWTTPPSPGSGWRVQTS